MSAVASMTGTDRSSVPFEGEADLVRGVIHEFNNHLTAIAGYSEFLEQDLALGDPRREDVGEIRDLVQRAADVTRHFALFLQKWPAQPRPFALDDLVRALEKLLRRVVREDIDIVLDLAADGVFVRGDAGVVDRILLDLAAEARRRMPHGGVLTIRTRSVALEELHGVPAQDEGYVALGINHTGSAGAVSEATRSLVASTDGLVGGWMFDGPQGVCILLPRAAEDAPVAVEAAPPTRRTILLVEDEGALRVVARRSLTRMGYDVIESANGVDALNAAARSARPIDLLITDIVMPQMGGFDLARAMTTRYPGIPVLFVSGYAPERLTPTLHGARTGYMEKPFSFERLETAVRRLIAEAGVDAS